MFFAKKPNPCGDPAWDGMRFGFDDPRIPEPIRQSVGQVAQMGDMLFFAATPEGGEWWLLDADGELVEAFWLK